ncbi:hypothetical protein [Methylobacterium gregans]|uniref:Uncharacterized protein n=1 Tax=Methylobacterium gregans TaxID=374424 RepID=A0AA37HL03_9HYPH|nr:hypothetical protein [Methylobacterium gregans]MDQ0521725.1 hypothetical protein [Methylobacterium gregans]GJD77113.1 hypothetical protein NBEOAGPD_0316 [Methylobacterium gregans]
MKSRLLRESARLALLAALAAGPTTFPTHAADGTLGGTLGQARPRLEIGAEIWRLRPSQTSATLPAATAHRGQATEIPETRRNVRMVYPALVEAR